MARPDTTSLKQLLESARSISILLPTKPHYDTVAAGLALKISLENSGKTVVVACADPMTVEFNRLVGVDSITPNFGSRNLLITFAEQTEHVDKVSYNLENGELQLVITPKATAPDLDHRRLKYVSGSGKSDLIILIAVHQLEDLGPLYHSAKDVFSSSKIVSITRDLPGVNYTPHQFYDPESSSLSELVAHIVDTINLTFHPDAATNLLSGLETTTDNFTSHLVSTTTFEIAAHLLRRGARRQNAISSADFPPGSIPTVSPTQQAAVSGFGTDNTEDTQDTAAKTKAPDDWYEPKIYKGPMQP